MFASPLDKSALIRAFSSPPPPVLAKCLIRALPPDLETSYMPAHVLVVATFSHSLAPGVATFAESIVAKLPFAKKEMAERAQRACRILKSLDLEEVAACCVEFQYLTRTLRLALAQNLVPDDERRDLIRVLDQAEPKSGIFYLRHHPDSPLPILPEELRSSASVFTVEKLRRLEAPFLIEFQTQKHAEPEKVVLDFSPPLHSENSPASELTKLTRHLKWLKGCVTATTLAAAGVFGICAATHYLGSPNMSLYALSGTLMILSGSLMLVLKRKSREASRLRAELGGLGALSEFG